jgi:2-amino-4-hydroxy-6-hydroxymethyldihydropteridine diphosphokinase
MSALRFCAGAMAEALIAMGGNLGSVRATLDRAAAALCDGREVRLLARSSDYRTPPWGVTDQPAFVNLCLVVATDLGPRALLDRARRIEAAFGRNRAGEQRWGPRTLDIDIIAYDQLAIDEGGLTLPHPRALERAFVLVPLAEIAPDRKIGGVTVADALTRLDCSGIEKLPPR